MLKFYMDEHVSSAITHGLRLVGVDVLTAREDGRAGTPDPLLLTRATELNRILFTRDDDLVKIGVQRQVTGILFTGIVYAHQLRVAIGTIIEDLEIIAKVSEPTEFQNHIEHLPLSYVHQTGITRR